MSPEQIQGDHEIDGRSDIYSLGVVLYHMLCGSVPYDGVTAASVMMMHLINPVPEIRLLNKSLPVGIQAILEKAMSKNPKDRYQSAGEFAKAIQAVTTGVFKKPVLHNVKPAAANGTEKPSIGSLPPAKPAGSRRPHRAASAGPAHNNGIVVPVLVGKRNEQTPVSPSSAGNISASARVSAPPASSPEPLLRKIARTVPTWGWVLSITLIFILSLTVFQWYRDGFPFSLLPDATPIPESNSSSGAPGQADKLAFLNESNIWVSNLDGSGLIRLTTDGLEKSHLNWSPDGSSILFTSRNCLSSVELETARCKALRVSPEPIR
jgi:serine/threonine protein kinase